jgi:hypothetical protein
MGLTPTAFVRASVDRGLSAARETQAEQESDYIKDFDQGVRADVAAMVAKLHGFKARERWPRLARFVSDGGDAGPILEVVLLEAVKARAYNSTHDDILSRAEASLVESLLREHVKSTCEADPP